MLSAFDSKLGLNFAQPQARKGLVDASTEISDKSLTLDCSMEYSL